MSCVAVRIEYSVHFFRNILIGQPEVVYRDTRVFCKNTVAINAYSLRIGAKMSASCTAVAAFTANDVSFGGNDIAYFKGRSVSLNLNDFTDKLVTDGHRRFDRILRPLVPIVDMYVGAADCGIMYLNQSFAVVDNGNFFANKFQTGLSRRFDNCIHFHSILPLFTSVFS